MPINVFIADDQNLVKNGLRVLLESECDVNVVGMAENGFECLNEVSKLNPNIVILDDKMPNLDGIKTLQIMKEQKFNVRILLLAETNENILKAIEYGCDGFILKSCEISTLKKAIYNIYNGQIYIQEELKTNIAESINQKNNYENKLNELTNREIEVLRLIADGLFNKEIASELNISERTVKNHVSSIFKKIMVNDRTQAAVFAIKHNLVDL